MITAFILRALFVSFENVFSFECLNVYCIFLLQNKKESIWCSDQTPIQLWRSIQQRNWDRSTISRAWLRWIKRYENTNSNYIEICPWLRIHIQGVRCIFGHIENGHCRALSRWAFAYDKINNFKVLDMHPARVQITLPTKSYHSIWCLWTLNFS